MNKLIAATLFATIGITAGLRAQDGKCPHMDVRPVRAGYEMAKTGDKCGVGLDFDWRGVRVTSEASFCPLFVIFTPGYAEPYSRSGSETFARPASTYAVTRVDYQCEGGFLFFSRGSCRGHGPVNVGAVTDYHVFACVDARSVLTR